MYVSSPLGAFGYFGASKAPVRKPVAAKKPTPVRSAAPKPAVKKTIAPKPVAKTPVRSAAPRPGAKPVMKPVAAKPPQPKVTVVAVSKTDVRRLQNALRALSPLVNDKSLLIGADGLVGPKTVAAVNKAFTTAVAAPANFRTGALTMAIIGANAVALAKLVENEVALRKKARVAKPASKPASKTLTTVASKVASKGSAAVVTLQNALRDIGNKINDGTLKAIKADGLIGPKTVAATNRALSKYASTAPKEMRSGKLSQAQVMKDLAVITGYLQKTIAAGVPGVQRTPNTAPSQSLPEMPAPGDDGTDVLPDVQPYQEESAKAASSPATAQMPSAPDAGVPPAAASSLPDFPEDKPSSPIPPMPSPAASFPTASTSPGGGGGGGGGGDLAPVPSAPSDETAPSTPAEAQAALSPKKEFPWKPVLIGGGVAVGLGTAAFLLFRNPSPHNRPRRRTA